MTKLSLPDFLERMKYIHKEKYDFSQFELINSKVKSMVICLKHGPFYITADQLTRKQGCKKCGYEKNSLDNTITQNEFLIKVKNKHGNKYDLTNFKYVNSQTPGYIKCSKHGEILINPVSFLSGRGCYKCGKESMAKKHTLTQEMFLEKANKLLHFQDNSYDLSKFEYINSKVKGEVICKKHGSFYTTPNMLFKNRGCPKCSISNGEIKIKTFLSNNNFNYIIQHSFNDCINSHKLKFDFYLPDHNICVEYDGIQHVKPIQFNGISIKKAQNNFQYIQINDQIKTDYCKNNGIELLRIPKKLIIFY